MVYTISFSLNKAMFLWAAVVLWFASGFVPWVTLSFGGTGFMGISVTDMYGLISVVSNPGAYRGGSPVSYAAAVFASGIGVMLIIGWTLSMIMMLVAALTRRQKSVLTAGILGVLPAIIWIAALSALSAVPTYASGGPVLVSPGVGPGAGAGVGMFAGFVAVYSYFKGRNNKQPDVSKKSAI